MFMVDISKVDGGHTHIYIYIYIYTQYIYNKNLTGGV